MPDSIRPLTDWIGRTETIVETLHTDRIAGLAALLDDEMMAIAAGSVLPPTAHWLYFNRPARQSELGVDGHPSKGGFLPPIQLPRRMWAGSRIEYRHPLHVGETVTRSTEIIDVSEKSGKSGPLAFLTLSHTYEGRHGIALIEEQDIVYREQSKGNKARVRNPSQENGDVLRGLIADEVMLFRYSALTFNAHRIHYDRPYVESIEGYPGLVVHGPLTATLMIESFRAHHPNTKIRNYSFRAVSPLFAGDQISVSASAASNSNELEVWAESVVGGLAMKGTVTIS